MSAAQFPGKLYELEELILDGALTRDQLMQVAILVSSVESFRRMQIEDDKPNDYDHQNLCDASYWRVLSDRYEKFLATLQQPGEVPR